MAFSFALGDIQKVYDSPPDIMGAYVLGKDYDGVQLYRMCYATAAIDFGEVIRDAAVITSGGTVTTAQTTSQNSLHDTSEFTDAESLLIGAHGKTLGTLANGGAQAFYVTSKVDDDELKVFVVAGENASGVHHRGTDGDWITALTTSATYDLWKPGRVRLGAAGLPPIGVCQVGGTSEPMVASAKYFYAKCSGLAECIGDTSDSDILAQQMVTTGTAAGTVEGIDATTAPAVADIAGYVGIAQHGDIPAEDALVTVCLDIPISGHSQHLIRTAHPFNAGSI